MKTSPKITDKPETTEQTPAASPMQPAVFATAEEANAATQAFFADVAAARAKHRISKVVIAIETDVMEHGEIKPGRAPIGMGAPPTDLAVLAGYARGFFSQIVMKELQLAEQSGAQAASK